MKSSLLKYTHFTIKMRIIYLQMEIQFPQKVVCYHIFGFAYMNIKLIIDINKLASFRFRAKSCSSISA